MAPLRRRRLAGIVTEIHLAPPEIPGGKPARPILFTPINRSVFDPVHLRFYHWCADYYRVPFGGILKTALPLPRKVLAGETLTPTPRGESALREEAKRGKAPARIAVQQWEAGKDPLPLLAHPGTWEAILAWTARGWVRWDYPGFRESFFPETKTYTLAVKDLEGVRLGSREREVVCYLEGRRLVEERELAAIFPGGRRTLRRLVEKGILREMARPVGFAETTVDPAAHTQPPPLSHEQRVALSVVKDEIASASPRPILLHGVTGSGKTELYIQAIQAVLERGKSALVLVPEIVLTPQLVSRIRARCGAPIALWHSHLTEKERWRQWLRIFGPGPIIVIGARSAVFTPVRKLGLIVVDEEHDPSFKQEEGLLYNARDAAVVRGREEACPIILGSATPSVESYHNVKRGKFRYGVFTRRPTGQPLPAAEIVDLREEGFAKSGETRGLMISRPLRAALMEAYREGQQSLLFLNRRGYARFVTCARCGETLKCPHCSVSLILHRPADVLRCHYCGYSRKLPEICEACGGPLLQMGTGTQRLEEEIRGVLPEARIARLDRDTMQKRSAYETLLQRLRRQEIDVLVGTQMIVKGHDYPGIVLMGILMADHSLKFPDFRASERTFQLLTQASGRCGRGSLPGRVIIQTFSPEHYSIQHAARHDFIGFYEEEVKFRRELGYPPFTRLAIVRISGPDTGAVKQKSLQIAREGRRAVARGIQVLGPAPALLSRLKDRYRWQVILKGTQSGVLHQVVERILASKAARSEKGVTVRVEFDPVQLV